MATLVFADQENGTMSRYETGGEAIRKTHVLTIGSAAVFSWATLQEFRLNPADEWKIEPDPEPTPPNAGAGTVSIAA